jgi:hypothetical protein
MRINSALLFLVFATISGCSSDEGPDTAVGSEQLTDGHATVLGSIRAFSEGNTGQFLDELTPDTGRYAPQVLSTWRWRSVDPRSSTDLQGVRAEGITIILDQSARSLVLDLFDRHEREEVTTDKLLQAIWTLDAIYASILKSHSVLNKRSIDQLQLSLTYAALDRAALSQRAHDLGLDNPPLDQAGIAALAAAARARDYEQIHTIAP